MKNRRTFIKTVAAGSIGSAFIGCENASTEKIKKIKLLMFLLYRKKQKNTIGNKEESNRGINLFLLAIQWKGNSYRVLYRKICRVWL